MTASSNASTAINDAENRIVGMMVGSAVSDAIGIYGDGLTEAECRTAYPRRRILASYKANELTPHYPDDHRAKYEVSRIRLTWAEMERMLCRETAHVPRRRLLISKELLPKGVCGSRELTRVV